MSKGLGKVAKCRTGLTPVHCSIAGELSPKLAWLLVVALAAAGLAITCALHFNSALYPCDIGHTNTVPTHFLSYNGTSVNHILSVSRNIELGCKTLM